MYGSKTHNVILLRPPPGSRFSLTVGAEGSPADVVINFEKGKEREVYEWIKNWNESYIFPEAERAEARARQETQDKIDADLQLKLVARDKLATESLPAESGIDLTKSLHDDNQ
jgi:hypothetical protein